MALRACGNFCFSASKTLSSFRHTIVAAQRRVIGLKGYLSIAWELVSSLQPDEFLWPASAAAYRYRWDFLLRHLDVPRGVTPGEIQWSMRLKHIAALEHYLQAFAVSTIRLLTLESLYSTTSEATMVSTQENDRSGSTGAEDQPTFLEQFWWLPWLGCAAAAFAPWLEEAEAALSMQHW
eukprot:s4869_g7.t1